jgi:hypothetical protein
VSRGWGEVQVEHWSCKARGVLAADPSPALGPHLLASDSGVGELGVDRGES